MDFSKAFNRVKHDLLATKLKQLTLKPQVINWYLSFLGNRHQKVICNNFMGKWKPVNKGTVQGSVSRPYLFNIFVNDLELSLNNKPALIKFADDSTIPVPVWKNNTCRTNLVGEFLAWCNKNHTNRKFEKCKELIFRKKASNKLYRQFSTSPNVQNYQSLACCSRATADLPSILAANYLSQTNAFT